MPSTLGRRARAAFAMSSDAAAALLTEVLPADHPLWTLGNALITPHVAGSQGDEWQRIRDFAAGENAQWATSGRFSHPVPPQRLASPA